MREKTKDRLRNYAVGVPLVSYAAGRLLIEEIIPEKISDFRKHRPLGKAATADTVEPASNSPIMSWKEFIDRNKGRREELDPVVEHVSEDVTSLNSQPSAEPPTDTHPLIAA